MAVRPTFLISQLSGGRRDEVSIVDDGENQKRGVSCQAFVTRLRIFIYFHDRLLKNEI